MSLDLVIAVAVVFGPTVLIVALIVRTAGPVPREHRAPRPDLRDEAGLRWPNDVSSLPRRPTRDLPAERPLPSMYERHLRHG